MQGIYEKGALGAINLTYLLILISKKVFKLSNVLSSMPKKEERESNVLKAKKKEFAEWWEQILPAADVLDNRYDVKGLWVFMPYGYSIMLNIKSLWDNLFKESGIKEMYFPLIVPLSYCEKNESWWRGFKEQAFWVSGRGEEARHILRPTGEPAMYPLFSLWIRAYSDLPLRIYESVFSYRYETKQTKPLIRDREIGPWYEIHTAHATKEEAIKEIEEAERMNDIIWQKLAIFPLKVEKPICECFPGAVGATEYYTLMPDGRVIENGSLNNLGQAYSKKFDIKFVDAHGKEDYAWQTCTGNGERYLGSLIAVHGDDRGLVIPPEIAPIQAIIVPIYYKDDKEKVTKRALEIKKKISSIARAEIDLRDETPGSKFYDWEIKGVPLRIEIGPKDIEKKQVTIVRRDNGSKIAIAEAKILKEIPELLSNIQKNLLAKSKSMLEGSIGIAKTKDDLENSKKDILKFLLCGSESCLTEIKLIKEGHELFGSDLNESKTEGKCIICGKKSKKIGYFANTY